MVQWLCAGARAHHKNKIRVMCQCVQNGTLSTTHKYCSTHASTSVMWKHHMAKLGSGCNVMFLRMGVFVRPHPDERPFQLVSWHVCFHTMSSFIKRPMFSRARAVIAHRKKCVAGADMTKQGNAMKNAHARAFCF